jgi:hypothetical protein
MTVEHEDDVIADKAAAVGKEMGVEKDEEPEFDIQEESEDDASIGKQRGETREAKAEREKLSNREKRHLRKKKLNDKFSEKDSIISAQQQRIDAMEARLADVDGRLHGINKAEVDKAINDTANAFSQAEKAHAESFSEGDGEKATLAMRAMYDAQRKLEQLGTLKQQVERVPVQQPVQQERPDQRIVNKAKAWAESNAWYKANGGDTDSEVAKAISGALIKEGYDATSDDFWDELDDRLAKYIPEKVQTRDDEDDEDEVVVQPKKRATPPVNGGSKRSDLKGKKTITLPTSYINMLKANGIYDDKEKMARILKDRERILREAQ